MRVYELAKEYGKKSTDFVDIIQSFGIDVKSHLSSLDDDRVVEIRNKLDTKQVAIDLENDLLSRKIGVKEPLEDSDREDKWTLGTEDTVVEPDKEGVSTEDIEEALAANIKAAGGAREKYAETVQTIVEDPENWSTPTARQDDDKEWVEKVTDADVWADAKIEEDGDVEVEVEKLTFWGWLKKIFI